MLWLLLALAQPNVSAYERLTQREAQWHCDGPRFDASCRPGKVGGCHYFFGSVQGKRTEKPYSLEPRRAKNGLIAYCPSR